jgi:serralysin
MAYGGELHGGRSDDAFFSLGITHYDGGSGLDLVTYYGDENLKMKKGVTVSLADPSLNTGEATGDTYNSIEKVVGTKGHDTLYGNNGANTLVGMEGNDTLIGGKGKDTLDGGNGVDMASYETAGTTTGLGVIASLANQGSNQGDAKGDIYIGIEGLIGSSNKDILTGDANANVIKGGAGDDLIDGGLGEDELWGDSEVFGVDGADTFAINGLNTGVKTIMDFDVFDMIKIDRAGFGLAEGYQLIDGMTYIVGENATAQTEHWTFLFDTKNNQLYFDEDGNGAGEAVLLAKVNFHSQQYLDTHDFLFV